MPRMARLVVPGFPHHVIQRGARRMTTFFADGDYRVYLFLLKRYLRESGVTVWAYCLMPNHVHLVCVPERPDSLAQLFHKVHMRYARYINERNEWAGHLWQERFRSFVMDEAHLYAAVRYVELNPVRGGLCAAPGDWQWSSVHAHLAREDNGVVSVAPMLARVHNWADYLAEVVSDRELQRLRKHGRSGRPAGGEALFSELHRMTGVDYRPRRRGRPKAASVGTRQEKGTCPQLVGNR